MLNSTACAYGATTAVKTAPSSDMPTSRTTSREIRLTRPFMTMPAVALPRPPGRLSAMTPNIRPTIASGTAQPDASTVIIPARLMTPMTIEAVASLLLGF